MSKNVASAFVVFGRYKGERIENSEKYEKLFYHDFEDKNGIVNGDEEVTTNELFNGNYNEDYKVLITRTNSDKGTALLRIFKKDPRIGYTLVQEETLNMNEHTKIELPGTDIVIRAGVANLEQATSPSDDESAILMRNIRRIERISDLKIELNKQSAKLDAKEAASIATATAKNPLIASPAAALVTETPASEETEEAEAEELGAE